MLPIHPKQTVSFYCKPGWDLYSSDCDSNNMTVSFFPTDYNADLILKLSDSLGPSYPLLSFFLSLLLSFFFLLKMAVGIIWSTCFKILVKYVVDWTTGLWRAGGKRDSVSVWERNSEIHSRCLAEPRPGKQCHLLTLLVLSEYHSELRLYVHW